MTLPNSILSLFSTNSFHFLITYFTLSVSVMWLEVTVKFNFLLPTHTTTIATTMVVDLRLAFYSTPQTHIILNIAVMIIIMMKKIHITYLNLHYQLNSRVFCVDHACVRCILMHSLLHKLFFRMKTNLFRKKVRLETRRNTWGRWWWMDGLLFWYYKLNSNKQEVFFSKSLQSTKVSWFWSFSGGDYSIWREEGGRVPL